MSNRFRSRIALLLAMTAALSGCFETSERVAGGGGLETTTGGGGRVVDSQGPAAGTRVRLVPADWTPRAGGDFPDSLTTLTDANGAYAFRKVPPGAYNLEAFRAADGARLFLGGVEFRAKTDNRVATDTLREPGKVRLHWEGARSGHVWIPGGTWSRRIQRGESDTGAVLLDSLPAGRLPSLVFGDSLSTTAAKPLVDTLRVEAGRTVERAAVAEWAHAGTWTLSASVPPSSALARYPALLRLTSANFDFREAAPDGADLRFADASGAPLDFEIERWDTASRKAEIWVSLDLGLPSAAGDGRRFSMHWGRGTVSSPLRGRPVFDSARGFAGVWHLSDTTSQVPRRFRNAVPGGLQGLGTVIRPDGSGLAPVAGAQAFDGVEAYIRTDDEPLHWEGPLLISIWMVPDFGPEEAEPRALLAQWEPKDSAGFILEYAPEIRGLRFTVGLEGPVKAVRAEARALGFAKGERHHVAASFDGSALRIHWDGAVAATAEAPGGSVRANNTRDFLIGALGDTSPEKAEIHLFRGVLDEARIHRTLDALPALPLDHALQAPGSEAIRLERLR